MTDGRRSAAAARDAEVRAVLDALRRIVRTFRTPGAAAGDVSPAGLFVLHALADGETLSVNEIAARTHTHQSSASVVVKRLVRAGLLARSRSSSDLRRVELTLTPRGAEILRAAPRAPQEGIVAGLDAMPSAERARLAESLGALVRAMRIDAGTPGMFFEEAPRKPRARRPRRAGS